MSEEGGDEVKTTVLYYIGTKFAEKEAGIKDCSTHREKFRAIVSQFDKVLLKYYSN